MDLFSLDEREDVQKKTFTKWINSHLSKIDEPPISDLYLDLRDGTKLLSLLQVLTGTQYKREKGNMRVHHLNNVNRVLTVLEQNGVKLIGISSDTIVDGNNKLTLGLVWNVVIRWPGGRVSKLASDNQYSSLERALLAWCQRSLRSYSDLEVHNFTTNWSDGKVFCALLHRWRPELIDYKRACEMQPIKRLELAFQIAHEQLGIDSLLDPEDVNTSCPDKKSMMMYVMCLFQSLSSDEDVKATSEMESNNTAQSEVVGSTSFESESRPLSLLSHMSVELGGYQTALEDVLTWLLAAEDQLNQQPVEPSSDFIELKREFHEHETFLLQLAGQQDGVGAVLTEGARLLSEQGLLSEEEDEIRLQMNLLNARWERLRVGALERQASIHNALRTEQRCRLDNLRKWLTQAEEKTATFAAVPVTQRAQKLEVLKSDIAKQKDDVDKLSDIVIIIDDGDSDNEFSVMEDELAALGERWAHICSWIQQQSERLHAWDGLRERVSRHSAWLDRREVTLKRMEANPVAEIAQVLSRIKKLTVLKQELDTEQEKLNTLQNDIHALAQQEGPTGEQASSEVMSDVETMMDRWDALSQIVDIQAHRISSSGFECNLTGDTGINTSGLGSSSQWELTDASSSDAKKPRLGDVRSEAEERRNALENWLTQIEMQLEHSKDGEIVGNESDLSTKEHLTWFKSTLEELEEKQSELKSSTSQNDTSIIQSANQERFNTIRESLAARIQNYERLYELEKNVQELEEYITELEAFLVDFKDTISSGNTDNLHQILEQANKHNEANEQLEIRLLHMNTLCSELNQRNMLTSEFKEKLNGLNKKWVNAKSNVKTDIGRIKDTIEANEQLPRRVRELLSWLDDLNADVPDMTSPVDTPARLFQLKNKCQLIHDKCQSRLADYKGVVEAGESALRSPNKNSQQYRTLQELLDRLTNQWQVTRDKAQTRLTKLQQASNRYGEFRSLAAQQADWLDRLERRLARSSPTAADAEDISEELDDLENYIGGDAEDRVKQLREAARLLEEGSVMVDVVKADLQLVTTRWERLREQAVERAAQLERSVTEAQQSETMVLQFQNWLDRTDAMLSARVNNDLTADDLPDDDQILAQEFAAHESQLAEMQTQCQELDRSNKRDAANRLRAQIDALNERLAEVKRVYEQFRRTDCIETRLSRAMRQLRDVSDASCLLEPASADIEGIQGQLNHCLKFYRTLSELKSEVHDVIKMGRRLVDEKVVPDPPRLTQRIDQLKEMYNSLGAQITTAKHTLEDGLKLLKGIHKRNDELATWLDVNENKSDLNSTTVIDTKQSLDVLLSDYDKFCKMCDPVYSHSLKESINDLKNRWERLDVRMKLSEWLTDITKEVHDNQTSVQRLIDIDREIQFKKSEFGSCSSEMLRKWKHLAETIKVTLESNQNVKTNSRSSPESNRSTSTVPDIVQTTNSKTTSETFNLAETSSLFSKVSTMTAENIDNHVESTSKDRNECHVVEVKESEIAKPIVATVEILPSLTSQSFQHRVEMVEIVETESTESIPDRVDDSKKRSMEQKIVTEQFIKSNELNIDGGKRIIIRQEMEKPKQMLVCDLPKPSVTQKNEGSPKIKDNESVAEYLILDDAPRKSDPKSFKRKDRITGTSSESESRRQPSATIVSVCHKTTPPSPITYTSTSTVVQQHRSTPYATSTPSHSTPLGRSSSNTPVSRASLSRSSSAEEPSATSTPSMQRSVSYEPRSSSGTPLTGHSASSSSRTPSPSATKLSSLSRDVSEFERQANEMHRRINQALETVKSTDKEKDPNRRLEILKSELSHIAPDAATLISRGDSIILELHSTQPRNADSLRINIVAKLRAAWHSFRDETEIRRVTAMRLVTSIDKIKKMIRQLDGWLDGVSEQVNIANNHEGLLNELKQEYGIYENELEVINDITKELKNQKVAFPEAEVISLNNRWQTIASQIKHLLTTSKGTSKFPSDLELKQLELGDSDKNKSLHRFVTNLDSLISWVMETKTRINISHDLPQSERDSTLQTLANSIQDREMEVKEVFENYHNLESSLKPAKAIELQEKMKKLREDWSYINKNSQTVVAEVHSPVKESSPKSGASTSATPTPKTGLDTAAAALLASFDKSVLQIRDWLTIEEGMLRQQTVVVSNVDEIVQLIDKQKSVLRELEQKKPQLDELVHTAENLKGDSNRQQLHGKVTKLREHWDETNSKVMHRKAQLDAMLGDSQRYEGKRLEVEAWLARMEGRLQRMQPAGHTADVLEAQLREQKSFHAELHQYKHHIELFNQLTQKLIAVYQQDDTTRVKKMTEQINLRYNNLNTSIINRGKLLNSAMNSLHNFDRSLDKFLAWLSEAESSLESVEVDAERIAAGGTSRGSSLDAIVSMTHHHLKVRHKSLFLLFDYTMTKYIKYILCTHKCKFHRVITSITNTSNVIS